MRAISRRGGQGRVGVTVADVARRAGVSRATAARVLGGYSGASQRVQEAVLKAADELAYVPNKIARGLAARQTKRVGILLPDLENLFFARLYRGVERILYQQGYTVLVGNTNEDARRERELVREMAAERVDGIILAPVADRVPTGLDCPVVLVDRVVQPAEEEGCLPSVTSDNTTSIQAAVRHLAEQGYDRVGIIANLAHLSTVRDRLAGFSEIAGRLGLHPVDPLITRGFRLDDISTDIADYLAAQRPEAVITTDAVLGLGVYRVVQAMGIRLGSQLGLISYDDEPWMQIVTPGVTAVAQPAVDMGQVAASLLIQRLQSQKSGNDTQQLAASLIVRESSIR
jgi:LacI family transcriptional regulator